MKKYFLEDVTTPQLYEEIFRYDMVPKVVFDTEEVKPHLPEDFWITCTTFRDGQQARPPYTVEQIVQLYKFMHRLGGEKGVIRQCEFFLYSDKDKKAVEECMKLDYKYPEVTGWIRAKKEDFKLVKQMGLKETGILTSASDYHIFLKLGKDRKTAMEGYIDVVRAALEEGVIPRCHLEDITRADFYGFVLPFVQELMRLSEESKIAIKIRACDTLGFGLPYPEAALPRGVPKLIQGLIKEGGVPSERLEWHGHNDFHKVLINAVVAWLYGCSAANGTLLGFGERTGNPPIEGLIIEYIALKGDYSGIDTTVITELGDYFKKVIKAPIPSNYPFVGDEFNVTMAGIHADGDIKNERIYNIFDTAKILNKPIGVAITDKSGVAGITMWINNFFGLKGKDAIDKGHPGVQKINQWVEEEYKKQRVTSISTKEMMEQIKKQLPNLFRSELEELKAKARDLAYVLIKEVAEHPDIISMDPKKQEVILEELRDNNTFIKFTYVTDAKGNKITKNITRKGYDEVYSKTFEEYGNFSDRVWFKETMKNKKIGCTDLYISKATGILCITVAAPIFDAEKENILGVLGIDINFDTLTRG